MPSGEEIYRMIMSQIDPDLLRENLMTLNEKYKEESPEQTRARGERYDAAFRRYHEAFALYTTNMTTEVGTYVRTEIAKMEQESKQVEMAVIGQLEQSIMSV